MGRLGNLTICQIAEAKPPPVTKPTGADSTGGWREARGGDSTRCHPKDPCRHPSVRMWLQQVQTIVRLRTALPTHGDFLDAQCLL